MSIWQRFLRLFGYHRAPRVSFHADQTLIQSLQQFAEQERRQTEDVVADMLSFAVAQRQAADENLLRWRSLSPREQQIAALVALNYTNRQIAALLTISPETVKTHIRNVLRKFSLSSKTDLRHALEEWDFSAWRDSLL